jgi:GT2 family glycosyltransferase
MAVISYNNFSYTVEAVDSLLNQTVNVAVVIWDNASPDGSAEHLKELKSEQVSVVCSPENVLWTPAINRILEGRNEPFCGFMNNDISLPHYGIERMLEIASRKEVGIVAPTGSALGGPQDFVTHHGAPDDREGYCARLKPKRTTYVVGACCLLRREVWDEVGPLDESMPLGADDHDYCIRLKAAGYQIWLDERVYAKHHGHASGSSENWNEWGGKSWEAFNKKYDGYYVSEEEATKCHWGGVYQPGWDK